MRRLRLLLEKPRAHNCLFTFYGQLAATHVPEDLMLELEQETFDPSGISTVDPPKMLLNGILISQPCGILFQFDEVTGLRYAARLTQHGNLPDMDDSTWSYDRNIITCTSLAFAV
jgi:hypothetical protein